MGVKFPCQKSFPANENSNFWDGWFRGLKLYRNHIIYIWVAVFARHSAVSFFQAVFLLFAVGARASAAHTAGEWFLTAEIVVFRNATKVI